MGIMNVIQSINGIFWGWLISGILLCTGVFYTIRLNAPQIRFFPRLFKNLKDSMQAEGGVVSGFGVLCAALGSLIGTGTLVGTATALASGGPGAIFWMWVVAFISMPMCFGEAILGQLFREKNKDGTYRGGSAYYLHKGLKQKGLALIYSVCMIISIGLFYAMLQCNSITNAVTGVVDVPPVVVGIVILILVALVIIGGLKRLADVTSYIVPFMAISYIIFSMYIVVVNMDQFVAVIGLIIRSAFTGQAAVGGAIGYSVQQAFRYGVARGLFSNDAGTGVAAGMHAGANVKHPVEQGFAAMLGTFIVTVIICTCTAFCILVTGAMDTGLSGINLTQAAFTNAYGTFGKWVIAIAMFLFAYTSLLSDVYLGEANIKYIFKKNQDAMIWVYRIVCGAIVVVGSITPLSVVWDLIDFTVAFIVFFNVIGLLGLLKHVRYVLNDYNKQLGEGVKRPTWDFRRDPLNLESGALIINKEGE